MISPTTILAAVTFSGASRAALVLAGRLARHYGARLHVLYVEDPLLDAGAGRAGIALAAASRTELRRLIRDAWPASDCSPELHAVTGPEVDVILDVAHRNGVDLIVVAGRRTSAVERMVFGSTTEELLSRSDVSVVVAPADWTASHAEAPEAAGLAGLLRSGVKIVRGTNGLAAPPISYRRLSEAAVPVLLQVVESVLG